MSGSHPAAGAAREDAAVATSTPMALLSCWPRPKMQLRCCVMAPQAQEAARCVANGALARFDDDADIQRCIAKVETATREVAARLSASSGAAPVQASRAAKTSGSPVAARSSTLAPSMLPHVPQAPSASAGVVADPPALANLDAVTSSLSRTPESPVAQSLRRIQAQGVVRRVVQSFTTPITPLPPTDGSQEPLAGQASVRRVQEQGIVRRVLPTFNVRNTSIVDGLYRSR